MIDGSGSVNNPGRPDDYGMERLLDTTVDYVASVLEIIMINVALSGDNAVVIAMAAHKLPARRRRSVIIGGGVLAMLMQFAFVLLVGRLMAVPGLRTLGALLLIAIACKLLQDEKEVPDDVLAKSSTRASVLRIALANLVMSFDNVLAVAGTCRSDPIRMAMGLALSIAMIFAFSTVVVKLLGRFPWIAYAGASLLAITAAGMIWPEAAAAVRWTYPSIASVRLGLPLAFPLKCTFSGLIVCTCLSSPWW